MPEEVTGTGRKTLRKADGPPCGQCLRARDVAHPSGPSEQSRIGKSLEWLTHSFSEPHRLCPGNVGGIDMAPHRATASYPSEQVRSLGSPVGSVEMTVV